MTEQTEGAFVNGWYIVEQLGHKRLAGYLTEAVIAGAGFLRIDIPGADGQPPATQYIAPSTLYALTPTTEETARRVAAINRPAPVQRWELPAAPMREPRPTEELAANAEYGIPEDFDEEEEGDDGDL